MWSHEEVILNSVQYGLLDINWVKDTEIAHY